MKKYVPTLLVFSLVVGAGAVLSPVVYAHGLGRGKVVLNSTMLENKTKLLGITPAELKTKLDAGKTFEQILTEAGITKEQLEVKMKEELKTRLQADVAAGKITQTEADKRLASAGKIVHGAPHGMKLGHLDMIENHAKVLGITAEDLKARLASGKAFDQILTDLNLTKEQFHAKTQEQLKADLQAKVAAGTITQAEADKRIAYAADPSKHGPGKMKLRKGQFRLKMIGKGAVK